MSDRRAKILLRALVVGVLALALGGPTPGRIGGCNSETGFADPGEFCVVFEASICARNNAVTPDEAAAAMCRGGIPTRCAGFNWAPGCAPTDSTANACLDALVDTSRLATSPDALGECMALCGGSGGGIDPEGI